MRNSNLKEIENTKLFTKENCNLIFAVKKGCDTRDLTQINQSEIKSFIKSKGLIWADDADDFMLDYSESGQYTDSRIVAEIIEKENIHDMYDRHIQEALEATVDGYDGFQDGNAVSMWLNDNKGYSLVSNYHANEAWKRS